MSQQAKLPQVGEVAGFLHAIAGFVIAALVTIGFGGTLYKFIAPGGWIAVLLALLLIGASAWMLRAWISITQRNRYSEAFVYVFAGVGLLYSLQLLIEGGF